VVERQEVCIALLFVGIDSEHRVGFGGNLGGLGLKDTRESPLMSSIGGEVNRRF
jgi:hypothetical protein